VKVLDLFSGLGGFSLGLERAGFETVAFCEIEEFPRKVLAKHWPGIPIYEDVRELTAGRLAADGIHIDVIAGGFPCQDISIAGSKAGIEGEKSGLWKEFSRLIGEIRPRYAIMENVSNLLSGDYGRWFGAILRDLATLGYDAEWHCIPASELGANHHRDRVWIVSYPERKGLQRLIQDDKFFSRQGKAFPFAMHRTINDWSDMVGSVAKIRSGDGIPVKLERDRIKALGNAVVPQIPELIGRAILKAEQ